MEWYLKVLKNYSVFSGRARRKEYWYFVLFNIIASMVCVYIDIYTGTFIPQSGFGLLRGIYTLLVLVPSIAVSVRRLHDINFSGWWLLITLIPLVGVIVLLVLFVRDGTPTGNRFGENPKMADGIQFDSFGD